ncbi:PfkB family carbohydrate kinase [Nocardia sp. NPDC048505]|uniref:carbohydrate kinase family protein n=1 Tax=unclassified Nocardia TaxID=2637762 RepID=UPI003404F854
MMPQDPTVVQGILARLGKHRGLADGADRLRTTEIDARALLDLPVVRERAYRTGLPAEEVVLPVLRESARHLDPTKQLIADATLALGLQRENPADDIDPGGLYATDLGLRRSYLAENWQQLHRGLGAPTTPRQPSVRSLRSSLEQRALSALAELLVTPAAERVGPVRPQRVSNSGTVTVIGGAVVDHHYRTDRMPTAEGTPVFGRFEERIGGKGFNRAIAAAGLGFRVRLITAVGDDPAGHRILQYLHEMAIETDLVTVVPNEPTPVAAVIMDATGGIGTIRADNEMVRLTRDALRQPAAREAITESDAVLLSFDNPFSVLEQALDMLSTVPEGPWLLVQPTPPLDRPQDRPQDLHRYFRRIDYLLGTRNELSSLLLPGDRGPVDAQGHPIARELVERLHALGVDAVCAVENYRCRVRSAELDLEIGKPMSAGLAESPGARAAFTAALALRLVQSGRVADRADLDWAITAMAVRQITEAVPPLSLTEEIDRIADYPLSGTDEG